MTVASELIVEGVSEEVGEGADHGTVSEEGTVSCELLSEIETAVVLDAAFVKVTVQVL